MRLAMIGAAMVLGACGGGHQAAAPSIKGDAEAMAPPMMGANELKPERGLFTGPTGEAVLFGGNFPDAEADGSLEPSGRRTGSPYRFGL